MDPSAISCPSPCNSLRNQPQTLSFTDVPGLFSSRGAPDGVFFSQKTLPLTCHTSTLGTKVEPGLSAGERCLGSQAGDRHSQEQGFICLAEGAGLFVREQGAAAAVRCVCGKCLVQ